MVVKWRREESLQCEVIMVIAELKALEVEEVEATVWRCMKLSISNNIHPST